MLIEMVRLLTARNDLELPKLQVSNAFNVSFSLCKLLFRKAFHLNFRKLCFYLFFDCIPTAACRGALQHQAFVLINLRNNFFNKNNLHNEVLLTSSRVK